jgi:hypothetical protein
MGIFFFFSSSSTSFIFFPLVLDGLIYLFIYFGGGGTEN